MRIRSVALAVAASAMLFAAAAGAQELERQELRERHPGASLMAAVGNVVFVPVRFALTAFNAGLGGLTGQLTFGEKQAANDVFGLTSGQGYLQPEMLTGQETLSVGDTRFNLQVTR